MQRPLVAAAAIAVTCAALSSVGASATNVAWSVSVATPGVAVNVGAPAYWGPVYPAIRPAVAVAPWVPPHAAVALWTPSAAYAVAAYPWPAGYAYVAPYVVPAPAVAAYGPPVVVAPHARWARRAVVPAPVFHLPRRARPVVYVNYVR